MKRFRSKSKTDAGRNPAQRDLPFAWWDAVRAHTARRRDDLVTGAELSPTLRRMLAALHARCCGKRICWPSLETLSSDLGYDGWPKAKRTMLRQIAELKAMGLLWVQHRHRPDGSQTSSVYAIRYGALRKQGDYVELRKCHRGVSVVSPGGDKIDTGGCQEWHRGASKLAPLEMNRNELKATESAASGVEPKKPSYSTLLPPRTAGGGESRNDSGKPKPSGWWAGAVTRASLSTKAAVVQLYHRAVNCGVLPDSKLNRVRIVALVTQTLRMSDDEFKTSLGGYVISHIERGMWNYLQDSAVKEALRKCSEIQLTREEIEQITEPDPRG